METKQKIINSYAELDWAPDTIYKYRSWSDQFHRNVITKREFFFAAPDSFEDPLDCKNHIRYDLLTKKELFDVYIEKSKTTNRGFSRAQHRDWARKWTKSSPIKDKNYFKSQQEEHFKEYSKRAGILSLTENPNSLAMWMKHSDNLKGFCVGLHHEVAYEFFGGGGYVEYVKELPVIYPRPRHSFEAQHILQVYRKLEKWDFEKEYRTQIFRSYPMTTSDRIVILPPEAFKCIILGPEMDKESERELIESIPPEIKHVQILKGIINNNGDVEIKVE